MIMNVTVLLIKKKKKTILNNFFYNIFNHIHFKIIK